MKNDIIDLLNDFNKVEKMGWIRTKRDGTTGIGYTFETLIGKKEDSFEIPDYNSIEIKTKRRYSKGYITLFNATPNGDIESPIKYLLDKFGYINKENKQYKKFNISLYSNKWVDIGGNHKRMKIGTDGNKVVLIAIDLYLNKITTNISWSFDLLKEKINRKNKFLAVVKADSKVVNGTEYFKYYKISFYKLKSFNKFIELINKGIIRITFKINNYNDKENIIDNHGTGFQINEKDLLKLYDEIVI